MLTVLIAAFPAACGLSAIALAFHVLRKERVEAEPVLVGELFEDEDDATDGDSLLFGPLPKMAVPRKRPALRSRNSR